MLGVVSEEASSATEGLAADGQLDLRRLLGVLDPVAVHIRGTDVELVAIQHEPDRDFVGLSCFTAEMGKPRGLSSGNPSQSCKFRRFHKLSLATLHMNQQFYSLKFDDVCWNKSDETTIPL